MRFPMSCASETSIPVERYFAISKFYLINPETFFALFFPSSKIKNRIYILENRK